MPRIDVHDDSGVGLVELLVGMAISGVVGALVLVAVVQTLGATASATVRSDALTTLQRVHERMNRNVRAADPIGLATPDSLQITVHDTTEQRRLITYSLTGSALAQTVATYTSASAASPASTVTSTVVEGLDQAGTAVFAYTDGAGNAWATGDLDDIAHITVTLRIGAGDGSTIPLTSGASIRNRSL